MIVDCGPSPEVPVAPHEHQNPDLWKRELTEAGWKQVQRNIWEDQHGNCYLGPFGAWRHLRATQPWVGLL